MRLMEQIVKTNEVEDFAWNNRKYLKQQKYIEESFIYHHTPFTGADGELLHELNGFFFSNFLRFNFPFNDSFA